MRRPRLGRASSKDHRDAFGVLRANLLLALEGDDQPSILVTSAAEGEGKTTTCAHLARSLAVSGRDVTVVDLDLRRPELHRRLGARSGPGVVDVLLGRHALEDCLLPLDVTAGPGLSPGRLTLLPAGGAVPNPTELLATGATGELLRTVAKEADIVLLDAPAVLAVADALVLGPRVSGALLVVETRRTPSARALEARDVLARHHTRLLGVVVNKAAHDVPRIGWAPGGPVSGVDEPPSTNGPGTPSP